MGGAAVGRDGVGWGGVRMGGVGRNIMCQHDVGYGGVGLDWVGWGAPRLDLVERGGFGFVVVLWWVGRAGGGVVS